MIWTGPVPGVRPATPNGEITGAALVRRDLQRVGVAWFLRDDWEEIKRLCVDELHDTYDDWLADAREALVTAAAAGHTLEQIILRPQDIRERERATGRKVDSAARGEMVTLRLAGIGGGKERP